jgi:hypothetical protein
VRKGGPFLAGHRRERTPYECNRRHHRAEKRDKQQEGQAAAASAATPREERQVSSTLSYQAVPGQTSLGMRPILVVVYTETETVLPSLGDPCVLALGVIYLIFSLNNSKEGWRQTFWAWRCSLAGASLARPRGARTVSAHSHLNPGPPTELSTEARSCGSHQTNHDRA